DATVLGGHLNVGPYGTVEPYAYSYVHRGGSFKVLSNGWISFSVPYSVDYLLSASSDPYAYARCGWGVGLDLSVGSRYKSELHWFDMEALPGEILNDKYEGILYGRLYGRANDEGAFWVFAQADAQAYSAVPVPGTFILLGSGLLGLRIISLRKKE
ncbi:MAG: PEP-CTERM sorting domain-containing protein, partial [Deltaproteobacteria bacterium]|nr:PEP-CTERM sorting domain-containing protein [Deltaproteobacteria bacterium]